MKIPRKLNLCFLLFTIIPSALIMTHMYFSMVKNFKMMIGNNLKDNVAGTAGFIDKFMDNRVYDLRAFSSNFILQAGSPEAISQHLEHLIQVYPFYESLFFVEPKRTVIASSVQNEIGKDLMNLEGDILDEFQKALTGGEGAVYISGLVDTLLDNHKQKDFDMEILSAVHDLNGKTLGVLIGKVSLDYISKEVYALDSRTIGGEFAYLVDNSGNVLITKDPSIKKFMPHPDLKINNLQQNLKGEGSGYTIYTNHRGEKVVTGFADLKEYGVDKTGDWCLMSTAPYYLIMEPVYFLLLKLGITLVVTLCVISFIGIILARKISRPIIQLKNSAMAIGDGELDTPINISSKDEIHELAESLNEMRIKLKSSMKSIKEYSLNLQEQKEWFNTTLLSIGDAVIVTDMKRTIRFMNPIAEQITGWKFEQAEGLPIEKIFRIINEESGKMVENPIDRVLRERVIVGLANYTVLLTPDGREVPIDDSGAPIRSGDHLFGAVLVFRDITDRRSLEGQLRQSQKMEAIGTLAGGIAHDFNNILSAVIGYTELAKMALPEENPAAIQLINVLKAGNRAKDLVQQILAFSRHAEYEKKPILIHPIIMEALKLLRASIPTTIEIKQNIDTDGGAVMADPTQIHQIIMNLCTNAYHAMHDNGGTLAISLTTVEIDKNDPKAAGLDLPPGQYLNLEISDTGHGMDATTQEKIFEPYFTTKEKGVGTGMGLAVVHGIVRSFSGHITVYSELGRGTTFHIYLPRISMVKTPLEKPPAEPILRGVERILVVDDDKAIAKMEQQALESLGYTVTVFSNPEEALITFQAQPENFDLILTDMTMPKITGVQLAQRMLHIRADIPIILCSGFSDLINEEQAKTIGIREYIMKPIILRDLAQIVRKVLDQP